MSAVAALAASLSLAAPGTGSLAVPAAHAFGDPGFHQVVVARGVVAGSGARLSVSLRDASRPRQRCGFDHPLSGCATVDWSDDPLRPNTPRSGVFTNAVVVAGRTLYLRPSGALSSRPEPFTPG